MNTLRKLLTDYLTTRRALGFKLHCEGTGLRTFVSFMEGRQAEFVTTELALEWAMQPIGVQTTQRARRLGFVRAFARYCSAIDARTQIPMPDLIPCKRVRPQPYLFAQGDIEQLLKAALDLAPADGLRRWTYHCLFGLLSVSGLRSGEARALTLDDVDLDEAVLTILTSKFGKSRLVPMHPTTVAVLGDYLQRRQRFVGQHAVNHVFVTDQRKPLTNDQALDTFQRLLRKIGLKEQGNGRRPHLHDLRHRFAVETLVQWYRDGQEVERRLPVLSAYLGHTEVRHTYWYLSARPELLRLAQERLDRHWEQES
ncbi:MAG: tyrosine-type recombinase/integrase [Betaproteobacteria bacterium]